MTVLVLGIAVWVGVALIVGLLVGAAIQFRDAVEDMNDFPIGDDEPRPEVRR